MMANCPTLSRLGTAEGGPRRVKRAVLSLIVAGLVLAGLPAMASALTPDTATALTGAVYGTQDFSHGFPQAPFSYFTLSGVYKGQQVAASYDCSYGPEWWSADGVTGSPSCTLQTASVGNPPATLTISWTVYQVRPAWTAVGTTSDGDLVSCTGTVADSGFSLSAFLAGGCGITSSSQ